MTRLGKIARLPRKIREKLNERLADGEMGKDLVEWLNALPEVAAVLAAHFGGSAITEQNLSAWKNGAFEEWLKHQEAREWACLRAEEAEELEAETGAIGLAEGLATKAALVIGRLLESAGDLEGAEQRRQLLGAVRELTELRRANLAAAKERREKADWEMERAAAEEKRQSDAESEKRWRGMLAHTMPEFFDEKGEMRDWSGKTPLPKGLRECLELNELMRKKAASNAQTDAHGPAPVSATDAMPSAAATPRMAENPAESSPIQPDQGRSR